MQTVDNLRLLQSADNAVLSKLLYLKSGDIYNLHELKMSSTPKRR